MNAGVRVYDITDLTNLQRVGRVLEGFLHLTSPKQTQVTSFLGGATIAFSSSYGRKFRLHSLWSFILRIRKMVERSNFS
jgi:hypothetical protein